MDAGSSLEGDHPPLFQWVCVRRQQPSYVNRDL